MLKENMAPSIIKPIQLTFFVNFSLTLNHTGQPFYLMFLITDYLERLP